MRKWRIVFSDGEKWTVQAKSFERARSAARLHNWSGISVIALAESPAEQRKARRQAIALAKQLFLV